MTHEEEDYYPTPKLDAMMARPEVWAKPDAVQSLLDELNLIINPLPSVAEDWEALHSMEDTAFHNAVSVLREYPEWRERILHKMQIVVDQHIPRW
jgi:hypothetical protein